MAGRRHCVLSRVVAGNFPKNIVAHRFAPHHEPALVLSALGAKQCSGAMPIRHPRADYEMQRTLEALGFDSPVAGRVSHASHRTAHENAPPALGPATMRAKDP